MYDPQDELSTDELYTCYLACDHAEQVQLFAGDWITQRPHIGEFMWCSKCQESCEVLDHTKE